MEINRLSCKPIMMLYLNNTALYRIHFLDNDSHHGFGAYFKRFAQGVKNGKRGGFPSRFKVINVGSGKVGYFRKFFLRQSLFLSFLFQYQSKCLVNKHWAKG
jgi:hypothetical protein